MPKYNHNINSYKTERLAALKKFFKQKISFAISFKSLNSKFRLPVYFVLTAVMLFAGYSTYIGFSQKKLIKAGKLEVENNQLKTELNKIIAEIDSLNFKASKIEARHDSLIIQRNIPTIPSEIKTNYDLDDVEDENLAKTQLAKLKIKLKKAKIRLNNAFSTDKEIMDYLKIQDEVYCNTPSIFPTFGRITAPYGWRRDPFSRRRSFHKGIDIANKRGTAIYATADGVVKFAGRNGHYGKSVDIKHKYGFETRYAHTKKILVKRGQKVKKGQIIALMGNSGKSTGPHVHYEVKRYKKRKNPWYYLHKTHDEIALIDVLKPITVAGR